MGENYLDMATVIVIFLLSAFYYQGWRDYWRNCCKIRRILRANGT